MKNDPDFMTRGELVSCCSLLAAIAVLWGAVAAVAFTLVKEWLA